MKVKFHKLDFVNDENFFLIGIHSNVEIFFLAYLLNKNLKTSLLKVNPPNIPAVSTVCSS